MQLHPPPTPDKPDAEPLLTTDEFKTIAARLERDTNRVRAFKRAPFRPDVIIFGIYLYLAWGYNVYLVGPLIAFIGVDIASTIYHNERRIRKDNSTAERLLRFVEETHDATQLGTIFDLYDATTRLGEKWQRFRTATRTTVICLLLLIQPGDADALNTQQRIHLRRSLFRPEFLSGIGYWIGPDYYFAALHALEQIGDKRDLPDIERLLKEHYITDEVRAAAERCVEVIRERVAREEGKDVLLRADRKPEAVETLLRPSAENADTPPQQLLRAATNDAHDPPV
jgi:hypothetical protein